jgi:BCD family chlorophyll transporter-like MFS transporter
MRRLAILQVSLINIAVGLAILPLDSTLNRIMINELGLSATLVAVLISLRFITSPLRIAFGRMSDRRPIGGLRRTWYIAIGMVMIAVGLVAATHTAFLIPTLGGVGIVLALLSFALLGFGVNLTTPLYFALVSDQSSAKQRARIMAVMFVLLGISIVLVSFGIGAYLEPYSQDKLLNVSYAVAALIALLAVLGLVGVEQPVAGTEVKSAPDQEQPRAQVAIRDLLLRNHEALRFFIYLLLTFVAIEAQEIILEPYGAQVFGMAPGETTRLTGIFRVGSLIMLGVGAVLVNKLGHRRAATIGIGIGILGLALIILAGWRGIAGAFMGGVLVLGLGSGTLTVTNLSVMINMTDRRNAGVFLGAWGFAQAVGVGGGNIIGGILRDAGLAMTGNLFASYLTVFFFEIVLLGLALPFIWQLSLERFEQTNAELASA